MWSALSGLAPPLELDAAERSVAAEASDSAAKVMEPSHSECPPVVSRLSPLVAASATAAAVADAVQRSESGMETTRETAEIECGGNARTAWDAFLLQRLDTAFYRGTALLPGFLSAEHKSRAGMQDTPTRRVVDTELWNSYWFAFSDRFSAHIDDVQEYLSKHESEVGQRRRVLVAASLLLESEKDSFRDSLTTHARSFGALEEVNRERCVVMLQFTSSRSAEVFAAWASSLTLVDVLGDSSRAEQGSAHCRLLVRLAPHDGNKLASTLTLGENVVLSTPFLEGLFKGIFDAVGISYQAGYFLIVFGSVHAAKIALHSLQRSLLEVFGLTLVFSAQHAERVAVVS